MAKSTPKVDIRADYISIADEQGEIVYWDRQEWLDDPDLVVNIGKAIEMAYTQGAEAIRNLLAPKVRDLKKGDKIEVRQHTSKPFQGLSYPSFTGTLIDEAGVSEGWDVVDVLNQEGEEVSIYCFSIVR